jgi:hypothetical protein
MAWVYCIIPMLVYLVWWVAFFPGMMNADSLHMWSRAVTGSFDELHTGFVPIVYSILARLWKTPGVVGLAQILFFGGVLYFLFSIFESLKTPRWLLAAISAALSLAPMVGANLVTLEKDIPFGIVILFLTGCCIRIVETEGSWLARKWNVSVMTLSLALLSLCRHEGVFPAAGLLLVMLLFYARFWKPIVAMAIAGALIVGIVQGPVYEAFDVLRNKQYNRVQLKCIDLSVIYYKDGNLSDSEKTLISTVMPLQEWRSAFNIYMPDVIIYTPGTMERICKMERRLVMSGKARGSETGQFSLEIARKWHRSSGSLSSPAVAGLTECM